MNIASNYTDSMEDPLDDPNFLEFLCDNLDRNTAYLATIQSILISKGIVTAKEFNKILTIQMSLMDQKNSENEKKLKEAIDKRDELKEKINNLSDDEKAMWFLEGE